MRAVLAERQFPVGELRLLPRAGRRAVGCASARPGSRSRTPPPPTSRASTSPCSPPAGPLRGAAPRRSPRPGAIVIDNSSAWRMDPDVPLVVPEVNAHALDVIPKGIVANPNCTTMVAMPVLKPLHLAAGLRTLVVAHLPGGLGRAAWPASAELDSRCEAVDGAAGLAFDGTAVDFPPADKFPSTIAYNVVPLAGNWSTTGPARPTRSRSCATRAARSSSSPDLPVACTCVRVPVFTGHSLSINAEFDRDALPRARRVDPARRRPGVELGRCTDALMAAGSRPAFVGRIRRRPDVPQRPVAVPDR